MHPNNQTNLTDTPDIILNDWLRDRADELETLVAPFRATRCRGHHPLRLLLDDPETRPAVAEQIMQLSQLLNWLHPLYLDCHATAERWRQQYYAASPAQRPALQAIHDPEDAARLLDALQLLNNEVVADLLLFKRWVPEAFASASLNNRI